MCIVPVYFDGLNFATLQIHVTLNKDSDVCESEGYRYYS